MGGGVVLGVKNSPSNNPPHRSTLEMTSKGWKLLSMAPSMRIEEPVEIDTVRHRHCGYAFVKRHIHQIGSFSVHISDHMDRRIQGSGIMYAYDLLQDCRYGVYSRIPTSIGLSCGEFFHTKKFDHLDLSAIDVQRLTLHLPSGIWTITLPAVLEVLDVEVAGTVTFVAVQSCRIGFMRMASISKDWIYMQPPTIKMRRLEMFDIGILHRDDDKVIMENADVEWIH